MSPAFQAVQLGFESRRPLHERDDEEEPEARQRWRLLLLMRYQARFNNGTWKVFDSQRYEDVDPFRDSAEPVWLTKKHAQEICDRLNARKG